MVFGFISVHLNERAKTADTIDCIDYPSFCGVFGKFPKRDQMGSNPTAPTIFSKLVLT
jgi:hypothetical protein